MTGRDPEAGTDAERDAWLREALRHAPDASAAPPPALRESILAEARAAAAPPPRRSTATPGASWAAPLLAFWSWLARPPVAAAFASVMAATLVGVMWWDQPLDEAMPREPAPATAARNDAAVAPPPSGATPASPSSPPAAARAPVLQSPPTQPPSAPSTVAPASPFPRAEPPAGPEAADRGAATRERETTASKARPLHSAPPGSTSDAPTSPEATAPADAPPAAPVTPSPPAAAKVERQVDGFARDERKQAPPPSELATRPAGVPAPFALAERREAAVATGALGAASEALAKKADPAGDARAGASPNRSGVATSARPMAALLASLTSEGERWRRTEPIGTAQPVDARWRAWLAEVDAAAVQWQPFDLLSGRNAGAAGAGSSGLALEKDGRPEATVRIEDGGVVFRPRGGSAWFAPMPPDTVAALRASRPSPR